MQLNRAFLTLTTLALAIGTLTGCGHGTTAATAASTTITPSVNWAPATTIRTSSPRGVATSPNTSAAPQDGSLTIDIHTKQVALHQGQRLNINFGDTNPSIGDHWSQTVKPDKTVLHDLGTHLASQCIDAGMMGCSGNLVWQFQGVKPGITTIEFLYCYRYGCGPAEPGVNSPDRPDTPVNITITVQ